MTWSDRRRATLAATAALPFLALPLAALTQVPGPIRIGPSWGRGDPPNRSAVLYTTVINRGVLPDRLAGGACPGFGRLALVGVDPRTEGDRADDKGVFLPPGATETLGPSGPHFTLTDAAHPVSDGQLIPCALSFIHSGQRLVVFSIGTPGPQTFEP